MTANTPKLPRWKRLLFFAGVVGLPITGWAIGERNIWLAVVAGVFKALAVFDEFHHEALSELPQGASHYKLPGYALSRMWNTIRMLPPNTACPLRPFTNALGVVWRVVGQ